MLTARPLALAALVALTALTACPPPAAVVEPPSPATAAPVEKAVRDVLTGYTTAATGAQARAALETGGTQAFVDALKAKAGSCAAAAESGTPPADCERDPIVCSTEKPMGAVVNAVVVTSVSGPKAEATAVVAVGAQPPANIRMHLADDNAVWKVQSIDCP